MDARIPSGYLSPVISHYPQPFQQYQTVEDTSMQPELPQSTIAGILKRLHAKGPIQRRTDQHDPCHEFITEQGDTLKKSLQGIAYKMGTLTAGDVSGRTGKVLPIAPSRPGKHELCAHWRGKFFSWINSKALFETMPVSKALAKMTVPTIISQLITIVCNLADTFYRQYQRPLQGGRGNLRLYLVFYI